MALFSTEGNSIQPRSWSSHLRPGRCHSPPFLPTTTPRVSTQTRKNLSPKKTTTHFLDPPPVPLAAPQVLKTPSSFTSSKQPTPTCPNPSPAMTRMSLACPPPPSTSMTSPCLTPNSPRPKSLVPLAWDASLRSLLGQYSPLTQILMPSSSNRLWMALSKCSAATKTGGTMRNKHLKPGTEAWKTTSFYTRRHWRRHQRDTSSMETESKLGSLSGKGLASWPSSSNSCQTVMSPVS